jgi:hypothetical protein
MKIPPRRITLNDAVLRCHAMLNERVDYTVTPAISSLKAKKLAVCCASCEATMLAVLFQFTV